MIAPSRYGFSHSLFVVDTWFGSEGRRVVRDGWLGGIRPFHLKGYDPKESDPAGLGVTSPQAVGRRHSNTTVGSRGD